MCYGVVCECVGVSAGACVAPSLVSVLFLLLCFVLLSVGLA